MSLDVRLRSFEVRLKSLEVVGGCWMSLDGALEVGGRLRSDVALYVRLRSLEVV
jgi:hypothetical protein